MPQAGVYFRSRLFFPIGMEYSTAPMSTRVYTVDITTATSGINCQIQRAGRIKSIGGTFSNVAAGKCDVSRAPVTLIGTAQPDPSSVLFRADISVAGSVPSSINFPCDVPVTALDRLYIYMSGVNNLGTIQICVQEGR